MRLKEINRTSSKLHQQLYCLYKTIESETEADVAEKLTTPLQIIYRFNVTLRVPKGRLYNLLLAVVSLWRDDVFIRVKIQEGFQRQGAGITMIFCHRPINCNLLLHRMHYFGVGVRVKATLVRPPATFRSIWEGLLFTAGPGMLAA